jgi:hypothetical protein
MLRFSVVMFQTLATIKPLSDADYSLVSKLMKQSDMGQALAATITQALGRDEDFKRRFKDQLKARKAKVCLQ